MKLTRMVVVAAVAAAVGGTPAMGAGPHDDRGQRGDRVAALSTVHALRRGRSTGARSVRHLRPARGTQIRAPRSTTLPVISMVPLPSPAAGHGAVWLPKTGRWGGGRFRQ